MLGNCSARIELFEADHLYLDWMGRATFYGFLTSPRGRLFRDEECPYLYCPDNGRPSVPPSRLATALTLQAHDGAADPDIRSGTVASIRCVATFPPRSARSPPPLATVPWAQPSLSRRESLSYSTAVLGRYSANAIVLLAIGFLSVRLQHSHRCTRWPFSSRPQFTPLHEPSERIAEYLKSGYELSIGADVLAVEIRHSWRGEWKIMTRAAVPEP